MVKIGDAYIRNNFDRDSSMKPYIVVVEKCFLGNIFARKLMIFRNSVEHYIQRWNEGDFIIKFDKL